MNQKKMGLNRPYPIRNRNNKGINRMIVLGLPLDYFMLKLRGNFAI
jgi:hypothetical protein